MKQTFIKTVAQTLVIALSFSVLPCINVNASEYNQFQLEQDSIEKITGTSDISSNLTTTKEYIAVADGTNSVVKIPQNASDGILLKSAYAEDQSFSIHLPKESNGLKAKRSRKGTVVYTKDNASASFAVQPINDNGIDGVRSLININNSTAPKEYSFTFDLNNGTKLVTDEEYLGGKEYSSGEIYIVDKQNIIIGTIDKPWAYDANGNAVSTYYKIENGNKLTQVINFTKNSAFPIVADPSAWQVTKCVGSIAWALGSGIFAVAKVAKLKKYIAALGGMKEAAVLLMTATTWEERMEAGGTALVTLAAEISGIKDIKENCFS